MTRSILSALLGLVSIGALCTVPLACQAGGVGDPCTPEDEYKSDFPGFKIEEENIESRSFQCATRICLVNHFQGRVSCPRGQTTADIVFCSPGDTCADGAECVQSQVLAPECDPDNKTSCSGIAGTSCDPKAKICVCTPGAALPPGGNYVCEPSDPKNPKSLNVLKTYVCHKPGSCQSAGTEDADYKANAGKQCCVPGTDTPVAVPVCGQCDSASNRNADNAVYCSCRCLREGEEGDPNFNYCTCPTGFECAEIRRDIGISDPNLAGSYCIREKSAFKPPGECGTVNGNATPPDCKGLPASNL